MLKIIINSLRIPVFIYVLIFSYKVMSLDITIQVKRDTELDDNIRRACQEHCQGNRRRGDLERMEINYRGGNFYNVYMRAYLTNHHHQDSFFGGGFGVYEYTVFVNAWGILDMVSCVLSVTSVRVDNDRFGIANGAYNEVGKRHFVQNCRNFISRRR